MTYEMYEDSYEAVFAEAVDVLARESNRIAFETFNAQQWIDSFAVYVDGKIDIVATAAKTGVPVNFNFSKFEGNGNAAAGLTGYAEDHSFEIHLSDYGLWKKEWNTSFGHELGHLFIISALNLGRMTTNKEEQFCDYFGLQVAVPSSELEVLDDVNEAAIIMLAERLGVDYGAIVLRLMQEGKIPDRLVMDTNYPSNGPNPFFSGKVRREVICFKCFTEEPHDTGVAVLPKFNFTEYEVGESRYSAVDHLLYEPDRRDSWMIALNEEYGRWTENDRAMLERKLQQENEIIQRFARATGMQPPI